jgi:3-methyladenine DNA glycosylase/8-oxoguanine DNA glycosylase
MKIKSFAIITFLFIANTAFSQSIFEKWPSMKTFHEVMSQTFHPVEEGDFEPLKTRSEELYQKAEALLKNDIPEEFRTNAILSAAERLQLKSKSLHKLVLAKASDEELVKSLTELHNIFHEIVGLCSEEKK